MLNKFEYPEVPPYIDNESDTYEELPFINDSPLRTDNAKLQKTTI